MWDLLKFNNIFFSNYELKTFSKKFETFKLKTKKNSLNNLATFKLKLATFEKKWQSSKKFPSFKIRKGQL